jgi:LruC domain-containing protein
MKTKIALSAILLLEIFSVAVFATTRYVSLTGSNTAPYTSLATAANTIQTAVTASSTGDVILVDDGTYVLSALINFGTKGITVQSINGSAVAIVDGNHVTKCFEINHVSAVIDGFTIRNGYNPGSFGGGVNIKTGGTVKNCILTGNQARDGGGVAIDDAGLVQNCFVYDNLASDNGSSGYGGGIRLLNGGEVRNCQITGNSSVKYGGGVNIWSAGTVYNCVIANNAAPFGAGIRTRNLGKVYNSIIYYNTGGVNWEVSGTGYFYYNCCTTPALPGPSSSNCITSIPMFVSIVSGSEDYHLQNGSPCIDAGLNAGWMATVTDLDGNTRIENLTVDMGPYETVAAPPDTDGDGVPDADDDYPTDAARAFNNYYPAPGYGTLAYEDLWPGKGDYDFNDLVCDYRFTTVTNASNKVVEIFATFVIKAFGASLHNGFGFQFANDNVNPAHLDVSGYNIGAGSYITLEANGLESGQSRPTVIVWDDVFRLMQWPGTGIGVNTEPGAPYVSPVTVDVYIGFTSQTYTLAQVGIDQYNPFLIVNLNRDVEVHLPDFPPTSLADQSVFGTGQDNSNPATGRYYKTSGNLPWAINIYESFAYPKEKTEITKAYNHFVEWAESNGILYPDWYQNNPGYREDSNIY